MTCPKCGASAVTVQTFQENLGVTSTTVSRSKYKQKGHGLLWWLTIGWWWWIVDLFLWIFLFFPRLLVRIFRKKKYVQTTSSVTTSRTHLGYRTVCTCQACGHSWTSSVR